MVVTNTPDVLTEATAELAMALTLAAARRMSDAERDLRAGHWRGWDPAAYRGHRDQWARRSASSGWAGSAIAMRGWLTASAPRSLYAGPNAKPEAESELGARRVDLADLLEAADIVSLHAPAIPETRGLIGAAELELIGPDGVLVNTSRGPLVDSEAVAAALESGTLGAAGLDVYENEPEVSPRLLRGAALRAPPAHRLGDGAGARWDGEARSPTT